MNFILRPMPEVYFGPGEFTRAAELALRFGRRVLLVTGARSLDRSGVFASIADRLESTADVWSRWAVPREPDIQLVDEGARLCRDGGHEVILAMGGGSVIDAAKTVAALAANGGSAIDYVEEIGGGRTLDLPALPVIAVPTTSGSGAEVSRNCPLRIPEAGIKRSIRHDCLLPRVAIVDPGLSGNAPRGVVAAAGFDALAHLVEGYLSRGAQPFTDALAFRGMRLAAGALWALSGDRATPQTHHDLALASLWGGIVLTNAGLGAAHGLAAPIGGYRAVPHAAAVACLLPGAFAANAIALERRGATATAMERFKAVAAAVTRQGELSLENAFSELERLRRLLDIPGLAAFGVTTNDIPRIVSSARGGSMRFNPVDLSDQELERLLGAALESAASARAGD